MSERSIVRIALAIAKLSRAQKGDELIVKCVPRSGPAINVVRRYAKPESVEMKASAASFLMKRSRPGKITVAHACAYFWS